MKFVKDKTQIRKMILPIAFSNGKLKGSSKVKRVDLTRILQKRKPNKSLGTGNMNIDVMKIETL